MDSYQDRIDAARNAAPKDRDLDRERRGFLTETVTERKCPSHGVTFTEREVAGFRINGCQQCEDARVAAFEKSEAARVEAEQRKELSVWESKLEAAGIKRRFYKCSLGNYETDTDEQRERLAWASEFAGDFQAGMQSGCGALLCGTQGTGKTHLGVALVAEMIKKGGTALFGTVQSLLRRVRSTYSGGASESEKVAIEAMSKPDLLVLDEIGVQTGSVFERSLTFEVLNERYADMRPTVLISNQNLDAVTELLGGRLIDRMREDGGTIQTFDWDSYRGAQR